MTFTEYLLSKGFTQEQVDTIVAEMPANDFHIAAQENLDERYTKLKEQKEQVDADLSDTQKLVTDLQKSNKDVEGLQTQIAKYQEDMEKIEVERTAERKQYAIKEALTKVGANDIDYMVFKLGDIEVDKKGELKDLDSKIKGLKESNPSFFETTEPNDNKGGYKPIDNKLDSGSDKKTYSQAELQNLSSKEIAENWEAVEESLKNAEQ